MRWGGLYGIDADFVAEEHCKACFKSPVIYTMYDYNYISYVGLYIIDALFVDADNCTGNDCV